MTPLARTREHGECAVRFLRVINSRHPYPAEPWIRPHPLWGAMDQAAAGLAREHAILAAGWARIAKRELRDDS